MAKDKDVDHEMSVQKILQAVIRYECGFCGRQFEKLSDCALHIEKESILGFASPNDIKLVALKTK